MAGIVLMKLARDDVIRDLKFTGRIFDAQMAAKVGLVIHLHENPEARAIAMAHQITQMNPLAIKAAKIAERSRNRICVTPDGRIVRAAGVAGHQ